MTDTSDGPRRRHARVAIIYDNTIRPDTTGEYCRRALAALGCAVSHYLPTEVDDIPPIYTLYLRVDDDLEYDVPDAARPLAYWAIDTHRDYAKRLERARRADWVFCAQRDGAIRMRADGLEGARWLPLACEPAVHRRIPGLQKEYDICFVGNTFPGDGMRTRLVEWIRAAFPRAFIGQAYGDDLARIYTTSRLVFNCAIRNDINMRVFEAAACGSLLITNDLADNGQDLLFTPGKHMLTYGPDDDLRPLMEQFLHDDGERERIAEAGMRHAHTHHNYRRRMTDLLDVVVDGEDLEREYPVASRAGTAEEHVGTREAGRRHGGAETHERPGVVVQEEGRRSSNGGPEVVPAARTLFPRGLRTTHDGRPAVSIVIPTFNNLQFTQQCVGSIRGSTSVPYEIILVDNGSGDGTARWAVGAGLRVIGNAENLGFPRACNQGILASDGEYVVLLNNDTRVAPTWLERLMAHADADATVGLVGPSTNFAAGCQQIPAAYSTHEEFVAFAENVARHNSGSAKDAAWLIGLCLLIPRRVTQTVGLLDERFGLGNFEDNDYCLRVRIAGYRVVWAQDVFIHHEGHQSFKQLGTEFHRLLSQNERRFKDKWDLEQYRHVGNGGPQGADHAWSLLRAERFREAYDAFEAQVRANPTDTRSLVGLGLAAEGRGVPAAAALAYRSAIALDPADPGALRGLDRVAQDLRMTDDRSRQSVAWTTGR